METPPDPIRTKSYYKKDPMLNLDKDLDKAKQVKKCIKLLNITNMIHLSMV